MQRLSGKLVLGLSASLLGLAVGEVVIRALDRVPEVKPIWVSTQDSVYRRSTNPLLSYELQPDYRNDAADLQGSILETPASETPSLPEGTFYHYQIVGMDVWTTDGRSLGKVTDIITTGSNDVYVVQTTEGEVLIPATPDVVTNVDMDSGKITIEVITGLL